MNTPLKVLLDVAMETGESGHDVTQNYFIRSKSATHKQWLPVVRLKE